MNKMNREKRAGKKGVSAIVGTVLILLIVVVTGSIVWAVVNQIVQSNIDKGASCFGVFDQVSLDNDYSCYNSTSNKMQFSVKIGNIEIDSLLVSVTFAGSSESAVLNSTLQTLANVKIYPDSSEGVKMPSKNSGRTYFFTGITTLPSSISIVPTINGQQCDGTSTLSNIDDCIYFVE